MGWFCRKVVVETDRPLHRAYALARAEGLGAKSDDLEWIGV